MDSVSKSDIDKNWGEILKNHRLKLGLTQEDLAEKINVSRQTISKWELGQTLPDIYNCQELCKIYNISLDELLQNDNIAPNEKFMFGYCKIDNDKKLQLPAECLEKMNYKVGDVLLCLGDLKQGIAFVKAEDYEHFAQEILKAKEKFNNDNSNN